MNTDERIADRHLREVNGLGSAADMRAVRVGVTADPAWAGSPAGQHFLVCLVNLLSRLTETVTHIHLVIPPVPVLVLMPYGRAAGDLGSALAAIPAWAVDKEVSVTTGATVTGVDVALCLGEPPAFLGSIPALCAIADGWRFWVGTPENMPEGVRVSASGTPLGPFLAACVLAGEVFKKARGMARGRPITSLAYSLWSGHTDAWSSLDAGPELAGHTLPPFYLVGAGAVGQGVATILGATPLAGGYVVTIDDDLHDKTNLNRCFLAGTTDVGHAKVLAVSRYLRESPVVCLLHEGTIAEYVSKPKPSLRPELDLAEAEGSYGTVVSCVDKGKSRQDIQGLRPKLILGGSTVGLSAKTNVYDFVPGTPCLGCHNPAENDGERLRELERLLRGMSPAEREVYLRAHVPNPGPILEYLADGKCGTVGETMLRDLATTAPRVGQLRFDGGCRVPCVASFQPSAVRRGRCRSPADDLYRIPERQHSRYRTRRRHQL
jgi:molybdopterin/thiamine biosynthesis adenylyltransferase